MPHIIQFRLADGATAPSQAYEGDAGWDLAVTEAKSVPVGATVTFPTGVFVAIPPYLWGRITGRSSTWRKRGLLVIEGVIDSGYRGEQLVTVVNLGHEPQRVEVGERLAQLILHRIEHAQFFEIDTLPPSARGENGFGSSGV